MRKIALLGVTVILFLTLIQEAKADLSLDILYKLQELKKLSKTEADFEEVETLETSVNLYIKGLVTGMSFTNYTIKRKGDSPTFCVPDPELFNVYSARALIRQYAELAGYFENGEWKYSEELKEMPIVVPLERGLISEFPCEE